MATRGISKRPDYGYIESLDVQCEMIEITSSTPYLDVAWIGTDSNGHTHRGDDLLATLAERYGLNYWCEDCRDEHDDFEGYFCRKCGEQVHPGTKVDIGPRYMPGLMTAGLVIRDGFTIERWELSGPTAELFASAPPDTFNEASELLEADPNSHRVSRSVTGGR